MTESLHYNNLKITHTMIHVKFIIVYCQFYCRFNFFSISLTENNVVEFEDDIIEVPIYNGIVFSPADIHRVPKVSNTHTWMIFGIPYHIDVAELLKSRSL